MDVSWNAAVRRSDEHARRVMDVQMGERRRGASGDGHDAAPHVLDTRPMGAAAGCSRAVRGCPGLPARETARLLETQQAGDFDIKPSEQSGRAQQVPSPSAGSNQTDLRQ